MLVDREYSSERLRRSELEQASGDPSFYDRPVGYDIHSWQRVTPGFETRSTASKRRKKLLVTLRADGSTREVAECLGECGGDFQCKSGICPSCLRRMRRWFMLEGEKRIEQIRSDGGEIAFFTLIVPHSRVSEGALASLDLNAFKDRVSHVLDRLGLGDCWTIGGIDFSLNGPDLETGLLYWQPHLHAVVHCPDGIRSLRRKSKKLVNSARSIAKPTTVKTVRPGTDVRTLLGYCMKSYFQRRIPFIDTFGKRRARKLGLKARSIPEIARYLDSLPIQGRLYLKNVHRRGSQLVLSPLTPQVPPNKCVGVITD